MKLQFIYVAIWTCFVTNVASWANADLVMFEYTGTVTSVSQLNSILFPGAQVGDQLSGTFSYSTNPLNYDDVAIDTGNTRYTDLPVFNASNWTFNLSGTQRALTDVEPLTAASRTFITIADTPGAGVMLFDSNAENNQQETTGLSFTLQDVGGNYFTNELPPNDLDLSEFEFASGQFRYQPNPQGFAFVNFQFTSITQVPEPSCLFLVAAQLLLLGRVRRSRDNS